jgi:hypothetical protein
MDRDAAEKQSGTSELLREFRDERSAIQREREAIYSIREATTRTRGLTARLQWLVVAAIVAALAAAMSAGVSLSRSTIFERTAMERFGQLDQALQRSVSIRVEQLDTPPFGQGSASCGPFETPENPCKTLCVDNVSDPRHLRIRCEPIESMVERFQDAVVVLVAGGHDATELNPSMRKSFGSNSELALMRARMVQNSFSDALEEIRRKKPHQEFPKTRYIPSAEYPRGPSRDSAEDRAVQVTVIQAIGAL